jgi:succinate-acetate transporter protein
MRLTPNITTRGRIIRAAFGILCIVGALVLVFAFPPSGWRRVAVVLLAVGGILGIFQARAAWCVVRASGLKTPF